MFTNFSMERVNLVRRAYHSWVGTFNFQAWIFRFANIIGERGTHGVIFDFIHKLKKDNTKLEVLGNGLQEKSYMNVKDCVKAMMHIYNTRMNQSTCLILAADTCSVRRIAEIVVEETATNVHQLNILVAIEVGLEISQRRCSALKKCQQDMMSTTIARQLSDTPPVV